MFDEKAYREHLEKFTKDKIIDLYIQKCFDEYMTKLYGAGEGGQDFTSGYIDVGIENETKTYIYCGECAKKEEEILKLTKKLAETEAKLKLLKKLHKKY